jgi:hypothetical protein
MTIEFTVVGLDGKEKHFSLPPDTEIREAGIGDVERLGLESSPHGLQLWVLRTAEVAVGAEIPADVPLQESLSNWAMGQGRVQGFRIDLSVLGCVRVDSP